jgi:8-oxo-dGTP diphosphatase
MVVSGMTVSGMIRRGDEVLLVCQRGRSDPAPCWALPGGVAEPGETVIETLAREVREETGLEVTALGPLLYLLQIRYEEGALTGLAFVFEVADSKGEIRRGLEPWILDVEFFPSARQRGS